jgi:hypothetical protein
VPFKTKYLKLKLITQNSSLLLMVRISTQLLAVLTLSFLLLSCGSDAKKFDKLEAGQTPLTIVYKNAQKQKHKLQIK